MMFLSHVTKAKNDLQKEKDSCPNELEAHKEMMVALRNQHNDVVDDGLKSIFDAFQNVAYHAGFLCLSLHVP